MDNSSTPAKPTGEKKKKSIVLPIILGLLVIGLGVLSFMLFSQKSELEEQLASCQNAKQECETLSEEQEEQLDAQDEEINQILDKYKKAQAEREKLGLDNEVLNEKIATLEKNMAFLKSQKNKDKKAYEEELAKWKADADNYLEQIAALERKADSLGVKTSELTDELAVVNEDRQALEEQVAIGSILRAENVASSSVNKKGKADDDGEFKAKNIEKIEVTFTLAENNIAEKDTKEMILRILEPTGTVMFDKDKGGHSFEMANGKSDFYTLQQKFKFTNSNQRITFLYNKGSEYVAGTYRVELFCEGHLIGKSSFVVK